MSKGTNNYGKVAVGEDHGRSKLTREKVKLIRASALSDGALALQLGVSRLTVNDVRNFRTWRHVL